MSQTQDAEQFRLIADVTTESGHPVSLKVGPVRDRDVLGDILEGLEDQFGLRLAVIHPVEAEEEVARAAE